MTSQVSYEKRGVVAVLTLDNPPVNALGQALRAGLIARLDQAEADPEVKAVVMCGAGRGFVAGADIKEFGKPPLAPFLPDVCSRIENASVLVVASLHGVTLGGGLEIALAAHARVADANARLGLPEVHLGLIPGAGGTQRLPRLVGAAQAAEIITSGAQITAQEAVAAGLLDTLGQDAADENGFELATKLIAGDTPVRRTCDMPAPDPIDWVAWSQKVERNARGKVAPGVALRAVRASTEQSFTDGLKTERALFMELMQTDQRDSLVHAFFAERAASSVPGLHRAGLRDVQRIGVVGGGTMGSGIAVAALLSGLCVNLVESSAKAADQARDRIAEHLAGAVARRKIDQAKCDELLGHSLKVSKDYAVFQDADLVIEAIFEDMTAKRDVFKKLDSVCRPGAILATNTSYLDVNEIASATRRPADVLGLHFFSPAHVMKLVEVVVTEKTAPDVTATAFALAKKLRKNAVWSGVCDGFIGNRILRKTRAAADLMVLAGASPFEVDRALEDFGFALGPYAVADLAGLDIGWAMRKRLKAENKLNGTQAKFTDWLCQAGHFGRKTGRGYYTYGKGETPTPHSLALDMIETDRAARGITPRLFSKGDIQKRYLAAMVNEAAFVLGEGIALRPSDIDVVLLTGYGFPRYRGGPCKWADQTGLQLVVNTLEELSQEDPQFWAPAPYLTDLVAQGRTFAECSADL
ncbi:MAG: 3-hydroxyacyl-CoA dehydrogenase NAD-binding domain-containing protein [Roseobacter sp.]